MQRNPSTLLIAAATSAFLATPILAADHLDAPNVQGNGQVDINDLYAFQSPANPNNTVLIQTINPGAGIISGSTFGTDVSYEFLVDTNGDAVGDITYAATFGVAANGAQTYNVTRNGVAYATGTTGVTASTTSGGQVRADVFDDPFFFDLNGFNDGLNFTGDDFFAGLNVNAIVLEVPTSELNSDNVGIYARTIQNGTQVDRMGRPGITTVLVPEGRKTEFNLGEPGDDFAAFGDDINAVITSLSSQANADALTPILLPDLLTIDLTAPSGFLNGRALEDDVIDATLGLLTEGVLTTDGVDANDRAFQSVFPYLATPNPIPEPAAIGLLGLGGLALIRRRR